MATHTAVAFIGLGAMGFGMATNLIKEGYDVTGFDVWGPTLERFAQAGGKTAKSPAEAVANKEYCVCMVATAQQAQMVLLDGEDAAITALPKSASLLIASTTPATYIQGLEKDLLQRGRGDILLVDCPVSGGSTRAAEGALSIMAGASSDTALKQTNALLRAMTHPEKLYVVEQGIGGGSNLKMCHQILAANQILSASEAMGFASHLGLDLAKTAKAIIASEGWSWMFEHRLPRMLDPKFQPLASAITIIMKDTSIITSEARRNSFPTPITSTAEQVYFSSLAKGYGSDDDSSLIRLYTEGQKESHSVRTTSESEEESEEERKVKLVIDLLRGIHLCSAAETLALGQHLGLDLNQVYDLCVNAAGGSKMLVAVGPAIIEAFKNGTSTQGWAVKGEESTLSSVELALESAISEAQRLKVPTFLGTQALNLVRMAVRQHGAGSGDHAAGSVIRVWGHLV